MELTKEQLDQVRQLAALFYTPKQIAIMLELDFSYLHTAMSIEESDVYKAYWAGWFQSDMEYRKQVKRLADLGSSPAQTLLGKIIEDAKLKLLDK